MFSRLQNFLLQQLRQGTSPRALAITCSTGAVIAVFPTLGTTTLLCFLAGYIWKLNQPLLQAINYAMAPIQLLMIPVFLKLGAWICRVPAVSINPQTMIAEFWADPGKFMLAYGWAGLQAIVAWAVVAPLIFSGMYFLLKGLITKVEAMRGAK